MGNYEQLKAAINAVIKTNGNQEITGAIMQNVLDTMVSNIGAYRTFAGVATLSTAPGTPDQNVFYIASTPGVYANFGLTVNNGEIATFIVGTNGWSKLTIIADIINTDYLIAAMDNKVTKSIGKNLFNPNAPGILVGKYINFNGAIATNANYNITSYIEVLPNENYYANMTFSAATYWQLYDANLNPLGIGNTKVITTNSDTKYIRVSYNPASTAQIEKGISFTGYEPYTELYNLVINSSIQDNAISTEKVQNSAITGDKLEDIYKNAIIKSYRRIDDSEILYLDRTPSNQIVYGTGTGQGRAWAMVYKNDTQKTINGMKIKPTYLLDKVEFVLLQLPDVLDEINPIPQIAAPTVLSTYNITDVWNDSIGDVTTIYFDDIVLEAGKNYGFGLKTNQGSEIGMYTTPVSSAAGLSNIRPRIGVSGTNWSYAQSSTLSVLFAVLAKYNLEVSYIINPKYLVNIILGEKNIADNAVTEKKIANNSVTTEKISNEAVTENKTIFFDALPNLFDPNDPNVTPGHFVFWATGNLAVNASYTASGFIPVVGNDWYYFSFKHQMAWYDSNKTYISGSNSTDTVKAQQAPANAAYLRCSIVNSQLPTFMVNEGQTALPYQPYGFLLKEKYLPQNPIYDSVNDICLPKKLYMLGGVQNDIFIEPLIKRWNPYLYDVRFSGTAAYMRKFQRVASINAPVDGATVISTLIDRNYFKTQAQINSTIVVGTPNVGSGDIPVQIIGDSFTQGAFFKDALLTKGYVPNIKMIGLRNVSGVSGQYDEGRGGWTLATYFAVQTGRTNAYAGYWQPNGNVKYWGSTAFWKLANDIRKNPSGSWAFNETYNAGRYTDVSLKFDENTGYKLNPAVNDLMYDNDQNTYVIYNGSTWVSTTYVAYEWGFDYAKYLQMWQLTPPLIVGEMLGLNDFRDQADPENIDFTTWNNRLETMIASYKAAVPNGKFVILTPCSTCGVLNNAAGYYTIKQNACMWSHRKNIIDKFDGRESEGIYIVDTGIAIDNEFGYTEVTSGNTIKPYAEYTGSRQIFAQTGNPHPYPNYPTMGVSFAAFIQKYR